MGRNKKSPRLILIVLLLLAVMAVSWMALSADEATPSGGTIPPVPTGVPPAPTQFHPLIFNQPLPPTPPPDVGGGGS